MMFDDLLEADTTTPATSRAAGGARSLRQLPTFYYLDNFKELRAFVERYYAQVLRSRDRQTLYDFDALSSSAQCLLIRLMNRKASIFDVKKIKYPELGNINEIVGLLRDAAFLRDVTTDYYEHLLNELPKCSILAFCKDAAIKRGWRKAECIAYALEYVPAENVVSAANALDIVVLGRTDTFDMLQYLYFGRLFDGTSQITLRDLGIVRERGNETYEPRFASTEQASAAFFFARERKRISSDLSSEIDAAVRRLADWPSADTDVACIARDTLALRLGRIQEGRGETASAIEIYQKADSVACLRSAVRLLVAEQRADDAKAYLETQLVSPRSDDARRYAIDTLESRFGTKPRSDVRTALHESDVLVLDACWRGSPERAFVQHAKREGQQAFRTENVVWRTLFGLMFWDLLFEGEGARTHSPFDGLPAQLADRTFYTNHSKEIDKRLPRRTGAKRPLQCVLKTAAKHYGTHNGVFRWRKDSLAAINALLEAADPNAIATILRRLCQDYPGRNTGYPDLMIVHQHAIRFVEVKAPGDQLRRHQLRRIAELREAGLPTEVVRIEWQANPDQVYVVVDVETTGGKAANHRVTEIGAVKVQNGEIVDRFSTLINPMRSIPPYITRLTGISEQMVTDAPRFSDISASFSEFLTGAIFVAHNVNFDYGFLKAEFERVGQPFRYPKLCTCASMRKQFKGHKSYSLKALCDAYDIPLQSHHRALCDAEAAAGLLELLLESQPHGVVSSAAGDANGTKDASSDSF
ncbi:MAG: exonuclease domain-containing protein [Pseudomonadota bacterium]